MDAAEALFRQRWPFAGHVQRSDTATVFTQQEGVLRVVFGSSPKAAAVLAFPHEGGARLTVQTDRREHADALVPLLEELGARPA